MVQTTQMSHCNFGNVFCDQMIVRILYYRWNICRVCPLYEHVGEQWECDVERNISCTPHMWKVFHRCEFACGRSDSVSMQTSTNIRCRRRASLRYGYGCDLWGCYLWWTISHSEDTWRAFPLCGFSCVQSKNSSEHMSTHTRYNYVASPLCG